MSESVFAYYLRPLRVHGFVVDGMRL